MKTCKDCVHIDVCFAKQLGTGECAEICRDYKNKADFVEVVRCKDCGDCPMCGKGCSDKLIEVALDLINRQRTEIERLRNTVKTDFLTVTEKLKFSQSEIGDIRAEAIKEFAERAKRRLPIISPSVFDNLVKEMTEGENES